jgi:hypothetical protein
MAEETTEQREMLANDIQALVSQLNERLRAAASHGLKVELEENAILEINPPLYVKTVKVRIYTEIA